MIDLHVHTTASPDAEKTPAELFAMARQRGVNALAFADHNTVAAVEDGVRLSKETGIAFVPCVEINTCYAEKDLHLLAYHIRHDHPGTETLLARVRAEKWRVVERRFERLARIGFDVSFEDARRLSPDAPPTGWVYFEALRSRAGNRNDPRLAPYLGDSEDDIETAYRFYREFVRGRGGEVDVPYSGVSTYETIDRVRELSATPVLAHPGSIPDTAIEDLVRNGLAGLEVWSTKHDPAAVRRLRALAEKYDLIQTAGSDYHGGDRGRRGRFGIEVENEAAVVAALDGARLPTPSDGNG